MLLDSLSSRFNVRSRFCCTTAELWTVNEKLESTFKRLDSLKQNITVSVCLTVPARVGQLDLINASCWPDRWPARGSADVIFLYAFPIILALKVLLRRKPMFQIEIL